MAQYIYICPPDSAPHNVDLHGPLVNGSRVNKPVIQVQQNSECWKLDPIQDDTEGVGSILPVNTEHYNLTEIDWSKFREVLQWFPLATLTRVAEAMRSIGCKLPNGVENRGDFELLSAIYEEVVRLHWPEHQLNESCSECVPSLPPPEAETEAGDGQGITVEDIYEEPVPAAKPAKARPTKSKESKVYRALRKH